MAAYAALVSLMHIIQQIQHHPFPPISLDKEKIDSLIEKVIFLQDFLEGYSQGGSTEANGLERRIADAAYAAEDIIESQIVDQILKRSKIHRNIISFFKFFRGLWKAAKLYKGLQKVIKDMDFIKEEVMQIKEKMGVQDPLYINSSISAGSIRSASTGEKSTIVGFDDFMSTMVGFDDVLYEMMDKLTGGQLGRQIIPIVGMGGIGKTTLARNIYEHQVVVQHFDIHAWVTISQERRMREILLELLCRENKERRENLSQMNENELGDILHKSLLGRRYLIIMDDIWDIEVWDQLQLFFPDNNNGSRIMITTRLSKLAFQVAHSHGIEMDFLDEDNSWNLFCKNVFGKENCPNGLKEIGKKIAKNCKGLPLSIVVIGGLLAKSEQTREYWEIIAENLNSIVSLEDDELCLKILHTSFQHLPVHLKPCFLYMGVFPEDSKIYVSELIKLWVAEGFLKPIGGKSLEEVAEEYFKELIDRNLILVEKRNFYGKIKSCIIHDLLRDVCLREAQKQKFLCVLREQSLNIPQCINTERRICIRKSTPAEEEYSPQVLHALESASLARSLLWQSQEPLASSSFRLLRVSYTVGKDFYIEKEIGYEYSLEAISQQVNLRYLAIEAELNPLSGFLSSVSLLWNLQTLIVEGTSGAVVAPSEIWKMPQLRHVEFRALDLPDPPSGCTDGPDDIVLENLQTLLRIINFNCSEEVVKRIPNIKKLGIYYEEFREGSRYCLNNLGHLHKLESLHCSFVPENMPSQSMQNLTFPHSLKKLTLECTHLHWEDMTTKIGSLPLLEILKLKWRSFIGPEWETVEGQFSSLKFLIIQGCIDLEYWNTDSTHFPRLEHLHLRYLGKLKEIPWGIGEIPTLQSIQLDHCSRYAFYSAKRILEEQVELGNESLQVRVVAFEYDKELESLASQNFQVEICGSRTGDGFGDSDDRRSGGGDGSSDGGSDGSDL